MLLAQQVTLPCKEPLEMADLHTKTVSNLQCDVNPWKSEFCVMTVFALPVWPSKQVVFFFFFILYLFSLTDKTSMI